MSGLKKDKVTVRQAVLPLRALFHHLKLFFLLLLSIAILLASRIEHSTITTLRMAILDTVTPVLGIISAPVSTYNDFREYLHHTFYVHEHNAELRKQVDELQRMKIVAMELEAENRRLRELVRYVPPVTSGYVTARIVGDSSSPFGKTMLVNVGTAEGVEDGYIVYNKQGVVGRVIETGVHSARVLLLTDINSRVPVMGAVSREHSILAGNNTPSMELLHLPLETSISVGERIITSGDGGYFPAGIPVGQVVNLQDGTAKVTPRVNWDKLEMVTIASLKSFSSMQQAK